MNEQALQDSFKLFSSQGYTGNIDQYKDLISTNTDAFNDAFSLFSSNGYEGDEDQFKELIGLQEAGKITDSAVADPNVESQAEDMGSNLASGLSEPRDAGDFEKTQEENTYIEDVFGKNFFTDFLGDLARAGGSGWTAGSSVNEAFDIYKGKEATDEEIYDFLEKSREIESQGMTDEMISLSETMARRQQEGYNGVTSFLLGLWDNPSAMLQYAAMSTAQMVRALGDSEEVVGTAAAGAGVGAGTGAGIGAAAGAIGGPLAGITAGAGAISGAIGGFMGGLSGAMETGLTTVDLIKDAAVEDGLDWQNLTDKQRFDYIRKIQNDETKFDDIRSKAIARGLTIGAIDAVTGAVSSGAGSVASRAISTTTKSALAGAARVGTSAVIESAGGMTSEFLGQKAAGQDFNLEEIMIEGLADKTFTAISIAKAAKSGSPKYTLNGQKMNGKQFMEAMEIMDDDAYVKADIKVENSPAVKSVVDNRRGNIAADLKVDSRINDVNDRAEAIKLTRQKQNLESNKEGNKTKLTQIAQKLNAISEKYADAEVDASIEQRKKAVALAVDDAFEASFNKNYKAAEEAGKKIGVKTRLYKTDRGYKNAIEKAFGTLPEGWDSSSGVFAGKGQVFVNKAAARRTVDIATGNKGDISVASHEVLHPIFNALIGDASKQGAFVKSFKKQMTNKQKAYVQDQLNKRNYSKADEAIELMNIFSDGIIKGDINYDQGTFKKLGNSIVNLFRSTLGLSTNEISFNDGRGVYNFLKEYNTSIKKGNLSDVAVEAIKEAELAKNTKVAEADILSQEQFSKTFDPEKEAELSGKITEIKRLAKENEEIAKKFNKEPIKGAKQSRLENEVRAGIKPLVDKIVNNRTKALYDPIAADAKKNVTREEFQDSMRGDIETMILNEFDADKQSLEKFAVSRAYLRANNLAKRLGIESVEDGGIKKDVTAAKDIAVEETTQSQPKEKSVPRGQATFDQLSIVDENIINEVESEITKEIRRRVQKGTLSETVPLKKNKKIYNQAWVEDYVNKELFKILLKKIGAIGEKKGKIIIPGAYIDFLNDSNTFDIVSKALPVKSIKRSYSKLFPTERIGRERTPEGNPIFRISKIDKRTFLKYFLDGKKTTLLERQKQLFREILTPVALKALTDYATENNIKTLEDIRTLAPEGSIDVENDIEIAVELEKIKKELNRYDGEERNFDIIQFSKGMIQDGLTPGGDPSNLLAIQFSKKARKEYENRLAAKRPDLKDPKKAVDNLFKWVDSIEVPANKKSKYEKLALYYMANGTVILPEDGYKILDAVKIANSKKIDPFSVKNPNEILERFTGEVKKKINPDNVQSFSNKKELSDGITVYDVDDSKQGQKDVRAIIDANWGEKANPWCLAARSKTEFKKVAQLETFEEADAFTEQLKAEGKNFGVRSLDDGYSIFEEVKTTKEAELDRAFKLWKSYNKGGNGFKIAFKNNKLISFRDGTSMEWWGRMDVPSKTLLYTKKANDGSGFKQGVSINTDSGKAEVIYFEKGSKESGNYEKYNTKKEVIEKSVKRKNFSYFFNDTVASGIQDQWKKGEEKVKFELDFYILNEQGFPVQEDPMDFSDLEPGVRVWDSSGRIITKRPDGSDIVKETLLSGDDKYVGVYEKDRNKVISREYNGKKFLFAYDLLDQNDSPIDNKKIQDFWTEHNMEPFNKYELAIPLDKNNNPVFDGLGIDEFLVGSNAIPQFSKDSRGTAAVSKNEIKTLTKSLQQILGIDTNKIVDRISGPQKFNYTELDLFHDEQVEIAKTIPKEIKEALTLIKGLMGYNYRENAVGYTLGAEGAIKSLVDENGNEITDKRILNKVNRKGSHANINKNLEITNTSKISKRTKELVNQLKEKRKLVKTNKDSSINSNKKTKIRNLLASNPSQKQVQQALEKIAKNNEINKLIAEIFISSLKDYYNNATAKGGIVAQVKALKTIGHILLASRNSVMGWRSLTAVESIIYDPNYKGRYHYEHNTAIFKIMKDVASMIIHDKAINFNYTSSFIPVELKDIKDSTEIGKLGDTKTTKEIYTKFLNKNTNFEKVFIPGAVFQFSKNLDKEFDNIVKEKTGLKGTISNAKSQVLGSKKGRFKFFVPPSADDFSGLLYKLLAKGKKGEEQQAWFKKNLFDPFSIAMRNYESYKQELSTLVRKLKKEIKNVPASLKKVNKTGFTNEVAVRVYLWKKNGHEISTDDLSAKDVKELADIVENNKNLKDFAEKLNSLVGGYPEPQNNWLAGSITIDVVNMINTVKRAEFLTQWQENVDTIFNRENMNKLRAAFGDNYVEALEDMLYRMKTGRNRPMGSNKMTNQFMNWVNDSVGTIMFFNTRSALLQTLSTVNFINWGDNNPIAAAKAFANQKQFWADFAMLFNSDFLKQRRSGLKNDINADDIAAAAETSSNKAKAVLSSLLKMGFLPTQIADSFAISLGGASFIRNRINTYVKEGMSKDQAEEQAFLDFQEVTEESQQSSRPDRISQQQASPLGRIILAFANTPMQYMRLTKKAFLDLKNGRGDAKTNITKIAYYMFIQNVIFSALQSALFAALFEDDDEEEVTNKQLNMANSMLDSILRGTGIYGAAASTLKNIAIEVKKQSDKPRPDYTIAAQRALTISPPVDSKMRKLMSAARAFSYKTTREKMTGFGLDNPAYYAVGQIVSAGTNIPLDRAIRKADNLRVAVDNDTKFWQSLALMLGYSQWDVGLVETSKDKNKKKKQKFGSTTNWKRPTWKNR